MNLNRSELRKKIMTILYQINVYEGNDVKYQVDEVIKDVIDIDNNSIVTKERNTARERERELLEQISNLLRIKNDSLTTTRINKN